MVTKKTTPAKKSVIAVKPVKPVKKAEVATTEKKESRISVSVFDVDGKAGAKMTLPAELFGREVNEKLLAQSSRVFLANQREGGAHTKTRGQVEGSTRKIYKQKGTGKARHGSIRAPIFVGGGIVFGPVTRDYHLKLSKSMRRGALVSALSLRSADVIIVDGLENIEPKTKAVAKLLTQIGALQSVLLVVSDGSQKLIQAARNIEDLDVVNAKDLNTYTILTHKKIVFTKKALEASKAHFV